MKVLNWIFSVFCILCLPVFGFHVGSIFMCLLGIASLPIEPIREKWEKLPAHKVLRPLILGILFVIFTCMIPTGNGESDKISEISTEATIETAQIASEEKEEIETSQVETESELQVETEVATENKTQAETEVAEENTVTEVTENTATLAAQTEPSTEITLSVNDIPAYSGKPYVEINNNVPQFLETDLSTSSYEYYSELDSLGRCGVVYACIGKDLMPTEERGEIGSVKPTGWHTVKYDVVDGKYLYNRCHLIGFQLSGENANTKNLITGTRYMNVDGMLPFENMVADYVKETGNHVMYRVSPIFEGNNLLASGVQMEAQSVEDNGEGILFNVFCYNVQPEVAIDYATGDSSCEANLAETATTTATKDNSGTSSSESASSAQSVSESTNESGSGSSVMVWISATGSKYHSINNCGRMNPNNARQMTEEEAINQGYGKCSKCW